MLNVLFNIVLGVLVCYALATPFFMIYCIKFGCRLAENPKKAVEKTPIVRKTAPKKMTEEEKQEQQYLQNILRYDGTNRGQQKIGSKK